MAQSFFRCTHYTATEEGRIKTRTRCEKPATVRLLDSVGWRVPGGIYCEGHATEIIDEYREKLNWNWSMKPIPEEER